MPLPVHPWLIDGAAVEKSAGRVRLVCHFADLSELLDYDLSLANVIVVGERIYRRDSSLALVEPSGLDVLVDGIGNRFRFLAGEFYALTFSSTLGVGANETLLIHPIVTPVTIPQDMVGSFGVALATATNDRTFSFFKNGDLTPFATFTFESALPNPVFECVADVAFVPGDYIILKGPAGIDATLANFGVTVLATR